MNKPELLGTNVLELNTATIREALEIGLATTLGDSKITKVKEGPEGIFRITTMQEEKGEMIK